MLCRIGRRRCKTEDFYRSVVACRRKVFVRRIERDALDVALVDCQRLELLKGMPGPHHNLGVKPNRYEDAVVMGPGEILDIVLVADETLVCFPVFHRRWLIGS